jgi:hypothetical protein
MLPAKRNGVYEACHGSLYCLTTYGQFIATVAFCRKRANFCVWFA